MTAPMSYMYRQPTPASDRQRLQGSEFGEFGSWQHRVQQLPVLDTGPSDDILAQLAMISNDSPAGIPQGLWARPESRTMPVPAAPQHGHAHGNDYSSSSVCGGNGHSYSGTGINVCSTSAGLTAGASSEVLSAHAVLPLPGGQPVAELHRGLSALSAHNPPPSLGYGAELHLRATASVERRTGVMAQQPQPLHPGGLNLLGRQLPGAQLPHHTSQQHMPPHPVQHVLHHKPQPMSPVGQTQQQEEQQLHAEISRLRQALADCGDEVSRLNTQASKLSKVRDQELDKLKASLNRDREEKLAKQSAAHNKRLVAKEEEMAALKAAMTKEKDKVGLTWTRRPEWRSIPRRAHLVSRLHAQPALPSVHVPPCPPPPPTAFSPAPRQSQELAKAAANQQKALRAKDEEMASMCSAIAREKEERVAKLSATLKDVKGEIAQRDEQLCTLRKALAASEKSAEESRKAHAAAAADWEELKAAHEQATAARVHSPLAEHPQLCEDEVRRLTAEAEGRVAARVAELESRLTRAETDAAGLSAELARGRGVLQQVVLDAHVMAETSIRVSTHQQELLIEKARQHVEDVTAEELHWLMTAPFRVWLEQSYTECDEVRGRRPWPPRVSHCGARPRLVRSVRTDRPPHRRRVDVDGSAPCRYATCSRPNSSG